MYKKNIALFVCISLTTLLVAGCGTTKTQDQKPQEDVTTQVQSIVDDLIDSTSSDTQPAP
jgi:uncharacterized protein YceK